jgi:hypothetical protein
MSKIPGDGTAGPSPPKKPMQSKLKATHDATEEKTVSVLAPFLGEKFDSKDAQAFLKIIEFSDDCSIDQ